MTDGQGPERRVYDLAPTGKNERDGDWCLPGWLPNSRLERPDSVGRSAWAFAGTRHGPARGSRGADGDTEPFDGRRCGRSATRRYETACAESQGTMNRGNSGGPVLLLADDPAQDVVIGIRSLTSTISAP